MNDQPIAIEDYVITVEPDQELESPEQDNVLAQFQKMSASSSGVVLLDVFSTNVESLLDAKRVWVIKNRGEEFYHCGRKYIAYRKDFVVAKLT